MTTRDEQERPSKKARARAGRAPRHIHFVSLGCPKNRVDSEVMLGVAEQAGYQATTDAAEAEVIVVNTCGFIDSAKRESIDTILALARHKQGGRCEKLVVAGCLSQRHPSELAESLPEVDHLLGSSDMLRLAEVLGGDAERLLVGTPADWLIGASDPRRVSTPGASAYVKIAEGCNRRCSFCVIPALRGKQRSRSTEDVVREVQGLAASGVLEVNLIAQDTVSYGRDRSEADSLATLVERVAEVAGIRWVRLFYLYPEQLDRRIVELLAEHPRVVPYVDMPLQHAADGMLRRMRRGHGGRRLRELVTRLRRDVPDLTFRTAFIVGHPGETDAEFEELMEFVEWARFERVGVFRYSDEAEAPSHALEGKVPRGVSYRRARRLMSVQRRISREHQRALVGRELEFLVEGPSEEHEWVMVGRHAGQAPDIDGCVLLGGAVAPAGTLARGRVTGASDYDLVAELHGDETAPHGSTAGRTATAPKSAVVRQPGDARVRLRTVT